MNSHDRFDGVLTGILLAGSVLSIYTLSQVDGNYFMLVYAVLGISAVRMTGTWIKARKEAGNRWAHKSLCFLAVPFFYSIRWYPAPPAGPAHRALPCEMDRAGLL